MSASPIRILNDYLLNSVLKIAPEKISELEKFRIKYDPCAIFTDDRNFRFRVDVEEKKIKLPTVALEYLWCSCYSFYVFYQEHCSASLTNTVKFDLRGNERSRNAFDLYIWGYNKVKQINNTDWPCNLPKPVIADCDTPEDCKVANELYLCAASWILHHEFAHIYHNHPNDPLNNLDSIKQERESDLSATEWILGGVVDEKIQNKRALGIAIATLVITAQDILVGEFKETTHPRSFQRLYDAITPYIKNEDHLVYAFSTVICHINMAIADIQIEVNDNDTWKQNLESCLVKFNRLTKVST